MRSFLNADQTVIVDFIATTCTTECPALSAGFSGLRDALGEASGSVRLISLSIDPEHDRPEQMKRYLAQYNSGEGWDFLTGSREDMALVLEYFRAFSGLVPPLAGTQIRPVSVYHLREPLLGAWTQMNGLGGASELMRELERIESQTEVYYYTNAKVNDTIADYEEYLRRYPRAARLQEIEQLLNGLEDSYYLKAKGGEDFDACQEYLTKFPKGRYVPEVTGWLNKLYAAMIEFIDVKGGCYPMGNTFGWGEGATNEGPFHEVCVDDFSIGKYTVTVGDFKKFVKDSGYRTEAELGGGCYDWARRINASLDWRNPGFSQDDRHPAVCVSWNDSVAFAEWLSGKTGRKYRLPSEAEWEYSARSGGKHERYAGFSDESQLYRYANFCDKNCLFSYLSQDDGYKFTAPVGRYTANGLGLHDMTGNVFQWINDWFGKAYYRKTPKDNPRGPDSGQYRVLRGGSWLLNPLYIRASYRLWGAPNTRFNDIGFRLVTSAPK